MSMTKKELSAGSLASSLGVIIRGGIYALIISAILSLFLGLVFYFSSISESLLSHLASALLFFSVLVGSALAVRQVGIKALWHGLGVGIVFFLIVLLLGSVFFPEEFSTGGMFARLLLIIIGGILGGILGVFNQA